MSHYLRAASAPVEAHSLRVLRTKMVEDNLLEQERADMLDDRETRQRRAIYNRERLQSSSKKMKELDAKRFRLREQEARRRRKLETNFVLSQRSSDANERLDRAKTASEVAGTIRAIETLQRAERNVELAHRAATIHHAVERQREQQMEADAIQDTHRVSAVSERRSQALASRREAVQCNLAESHAKFAERFDTLSRAHETRSVLRRVELDLQAHEVDNALREKQAAFAKRVRERREEGQSRAQLRADRRANHDAEYANYCEELQHYWHDEETRANHLVEQMRNAKATKARQYAERVERARANYQRLKEQEAAWQNLIEVELVDRLGRATRMQNEHASHNSGTAHSKLRQNKSESFDDVDRTCRIFNHVVLRHQMNDRHL